MFWILYILQSIVDACFSMPLKYMYFFLHIFCFPKIEVYHKKTVKRSFLAPKERKWLALSDPVQIFQSRDKFLSPDCNFVVVVQSLSHVWLFVTHGLQHARLPCSSLSPRDCSNSCHWVSHAIQPPHPLSFPSPPAFNISQHQVAKLLELQHQSFQMNIPWLFSFRIDWFDLCAVQGTLKNLPQHHSSILQCSAFLIVQLSHPYITTGKKQSFD